MRTELQHAAYKAISKACEKAFNRDELPDGAAHVVTASVTGTVDGAPFAFDLAAKLGVGHASSRASTVTPDALQVMAYVLELLELGLGEGSAKSICDAVVAEYAKNGTVAATPGFVTLATTLGEKLRREAVSSVAGSVTVTTTKPPVMS